MNGIEPLMNKGRRACAATLGLAVLTMLVNQSSNFWPGLLFGLSVGYLNLEILYRRVGKSDPAYPSFSLRMMRTGSGLRFSTAALGALAVIKFKLGVIGYAVGLMTPNILITVICAWQDYRDGKG